MNVTSSPGAFLRRVLGALALAVPCASQALPVIALADYPLFLAPSVKPNVMILFDNSESMDGTMAGKVINGDDPATRGNIARGVLRSILATYRSPFNWGLTSFGTTGATLYTTYAYFLGDATTMVYTNDCTVAGISPSNGGLRCIPNPEPLLNGFSHITYNISGDDPNINDVLYTGWYGPQFYGIAAPWNGPTAYDAWYNRAGATTTWTAADFANWLTTFNFTPTDAGWLPDPNNPTMSQQLWVYRGWGFGNGITGWGVINETVQPDSVAHFNSLLTLLGDETQFGPEIKNSAVYTPLAGSLATIRSYFDNSTGITPIGQTCQKNFVVMATDGNPTGRTDGSQYNPADWANVDSPLGSNTNWSFGTAVQDVFTQVTALRTTNVSGVPYDIQTYVIGMGDTVANPGSVAALNEMALRGGGTPTAFLGNNVASLTNAFQSIVASIQGKVASAASVGLNSGAWSAASAIYQAKFNSVDWSGDLLAIPVAASGVLGAVPIWSAASQVKGQNWNAGRQILTYKPSAPLGNQGIAFRWPVAASAPAVNELDVSQIDALNRNGAAVVDGAGSDRLEYLRGNAAREQSACASCPAPLFRDRPTTPLGDIVDSSPYYVGAPNFGYYNSMEAVPYSGFVASYVARTPVLYVGANDGMLHAFSAATGLELFAYVPSMTYSKLSALTEPLYAHRNFVDGTPTVGDAFYSGNWHTLLVSGLRSGGKGLFALDVTDPGTFGEVNAASIVRWEFQDPDLGYVYGQPLIVKTNNGRWSVLVGSGYNAGNASGHAFLFVIDAENGTLTAKIDTGAGTGASPNGLSAPAAIDTNGDNIADIVYAGDLDGHLWKFNLANVNAAVWALGNGGASLFDAPAGQSITARPDVTKFPTGGYMLGFGTGRYIASADPSDLSAQAAYGIRDRFANETVTLAELQQQRILAEGAGLDGRTYRLSSHAVGVPTDGTIAGEDNLITRPVYIGTKKGWYLNLPTAGERVAADAHFRGGRVVITSLIPDTVNPCSYGGSGWINEFDAVTGNRLDSPTFDTNGDNLLTAADYVNMGAFGIHNVSGVGSAGIPADSSFMGNTAGNSCVEDKYQSTSNAVVNRYREQCTFTQGRVMWRATTK